MTTMTETNAYWDAVREHVEHDDFGGGPTVDEYGSLARRRTGRPFDLDHRVERRELTSAYSWTVTDPATVTFVLEDCGPQVIDPLAGSGWWAHLLGQAGVDVVASDLNPPNGTEANNWHRGAAHLDVMRMDAVDAVRLSDPARTLLLSWPPYDSSIGRDVIAAYEGNLIAYIGEGPYGCCGDEDMWRLIEVEWVEIADHWPVQFYGLHDWVTIYERKRAA
uniref:hypothetical protein n=1 Tax=Paractinoplanes polyasparticus TaxID=2856853 RepID=UPI001C84E073|nr:hypothetical protein [Actinoplanes polyasparticus]